MKGRGYHPAWVSDYFDVVSDEDDGRSAYGRYHQSACGRIYLTR